MPRKKVDVSELISLKVPKLPHQDDFILWLVNNNYSPLTIYNYMRDLTFFALFLHTYNVDFNNVTSKHITLYKGWLKNRMHILALRKYFGVRLQNDPSLKKLFNIRIRWDGQPTDFSPKNDKIQHIEGGLSATGSNATAKTNAPVELLEQLGGNNNPVATKQAGNEPEFKETAKTPINRGNYAKWNNPKELDGASLNRMLTALRQFLRFLVENNYSPPISADAVKLVKQPKKMPAVPSLQEVLQLVEAPSTLEKDEFVAKRNRAMLETLLATGMRISELISLDKTQINHEGKLYITGKGRKQRLVYLTPRALKHILEYLQIRKDPYPALFIPKRAQLGKAGVADPRISANYLQSKIVEYRQALGIVFPITAHTIRHAFATYMVEQGANPAILQRLLGHESLHTTTKYVHASDIIAEREHAKYHPVRE